MAKVLTVQAMKATPIVHVPIAGKSNTFATITNHVRTVSGNNSAAALQLATGSTSKASHPAY